jgi:hypothetical protein
LNPHAEALRSKRSVSAISPLAHGAAPNGDAAGLFWTFTMSNSKDGHARIA